MTVCVCVCMCVCLCVWERGSNCPKLSKLGRVKREVFSLCFWPLFTNFSMGTNISSEGKMIVLESRGSSIP